MKSIEKILWPTDASESALQALRVAGTMAETFNAKIYALQVVDQVPRIDRVGFAGDPLTMFDYSHYEQHLVDGAFVNLEKTVVAAVPDSIEIETHVEMGSPREVIIEFSRINKIDLIVMATHGRKGFSQFWLGSVAESTVRHAPIPTLIIPIVDGENS